MFISEEISFILGGFWGLLVHGVVRRPIFWTSILRWFLSYFWEDFKESLKSGWKLFSSIKPEVFAKGFNQNIEFYRGKRPSQCISSRRNRTQFSLTHLRQKVSKTRGFCKVCSRSPLKCTKTNGFLTIVVHRCAKTQVFFHLFHYCLIHLPYKMLTFLVFVTCSSARRCQNVEKTQNFT